MGKNSIGFGSSIQSEKEVSKYEQMGNGVKRKTKLDVVGYNVNVPLYLQGIPNCMINAHKTMVNDVINIVYDCGQTAEASASDLEKGAIETMKHIIDIERQHKRVNLYLVHCSTFDGDNGYVYGMKLKDAGEPLNIKKLAFPLCSPAMFRRIIFNCVETLVEDECWGYGCTTHNTTTILEIVKQVFNKDTFSLWNYKGKVGDVLYGQICKNK